jgi:hypothetical protein
MTDEDRLWRMSRAGWRCVCGLTMSVAGLCLPAAAQTPPEPTKHSAVLDLPDDGFLIGRLVPAAAEPGRSRTTLLWQSPLFDEPLEFAVEGIERIRFPKVAAVPAGANVWRADLRGGDCVEGVIESIDADHLVLQADGVGARPLRIRREQLVRLARKGAASKLIVPGGLGGWDTAGGAWQEQGGRLVGVKPGSSVQRNVEAPARACFTLVLSWDDRPDLDLLFAAGREEMARIKAGGGKKGAATEEYRIEVTAGDVLAIREGATAKFDLAHSLPAGRGGVELKVFIDQERGRMAVVIPQSDADGKAAFDETLPPRQPGVRSGFGIRLRGGDVRIDGLRVSPWRDPEPRDSGDGGLGGPGVVEAFDKAQGTFTVRGPDGPRTVNAVDVEDIEFPAADADQPGPPPGAVLAAFHGGSRLTGGILEVTAQSLRLDCPALAEPLECPLARLAVLDAGGAGQPPELPGRPAMLDAVGGRMLGCLANAAGAAAGIAWQPRGAVGPVAIRTTTEPLRVLYRGLAALGGVGIGLARQGNAWRVAEVTPGGPAARDGRIAVGWKLESIRLDETGAPIAALELKPDDIRGLLRGVVGSSVRLQFTDASGASQDVRLVRDAGGRGDLAGAAEKDVLEKVLKLHDARVAHAAPAATGQATVYLKTGDSILCKVLSANGEGLRIRTDLAPDILVPAIAMRAVELLPGGAGSISKEKLARLLTLPRMQQADPPTHMLRLPNGDYLRGKLVSLDDRVMRMNVLGVVKEFPRSDVARLIWLSIEGDDSEREALAAVAGGQGRGGVPVRATMIDGRRLTLTAERVDGGRLVGESGVLGTTGVDLAVCDNLVLGLTASSTPPSELPYGKWKLKPATVPRALRTPGAESPAARSPREDAALHPLVGKRSPMPVLELLEPQANARRLLVPTDWEGRIAVIVVFAPGDAAGKETLPVLAEAFEPLTGDAVDAIAVASGEAAESVAKAVAGVPRRPTIAVDQKAIVASLLGKPTLPVCLVIDREGRVADVMPVRAADVQAIRTRVGKLVDESRPIVKEFAALAQAREAAWAEDRGCLEALGALLDARSETVRARSVTLLRQLTGLTAVEMPFKPDGDAAQRTQHLRRWQQWLAVEGISADLTYPRRPGPDAEAAKPIVGRTLVCRPGSNDVVELDAQGAEVFKVPAVGPWACDVLPDGHRLVGEHGGRAVVEYDGKGRQVWAARDLPGGPMSARRLENGNTLVALSDANLVAEYDPQGSLAWSIPVEGRPCDARRLPDGTTLVAAHRGNRIIEVNAEGRELWAVEGIEDPQAAQRLPNGHTLVAMSTPGIIREIDRDGRVVWQKEGFRVPVDAQRLPDGMTLVQEQPGDLVEIDPEGTEVKRTTTNGSRILRW